MHERACCSAKLFSLPYNNYSILGWHKISRSWHGSGKNLAFFDRHRKIMSFCILICKPNPLSFLAEVFLSWTKVQNIRKPGGR